MSKSSPGALGGVDAARLHRRVTFRILPLLCLMYFAAFIDRVALGYAMPHGLAADIGLSATMFGFASGIFFIGYVLLEIPSNALLVRFGSRVWLTRIMVSWGVVQALTAFVTNPEMLYVLRFLLGVAEAGFAPGLLFFMTTWFPTQKLGRVMAVVMVVPTVTNMIGPYLGTALVGLGNSLDTSFAGWRFMILVTGLFAVAIAAIVFVALPDRPSTAAWLSAEERAEWTDLIIRSQVAVSSGAKHGFVDALRSPWSWAIGALYFVIPFSINALIFFLPTMAESLATELGAGEDEMVVSVLTSIPHFVALVMLFVCSAISDRTGRHGTVVSVGLVVGVIGAVTLMTGSGDSWVSLGALCLVAVAASSLVSVVLAMVPKFASSAGAAAALAVVGSLGNVGGFVGPYVTGFLIDQTGDVFAGMWVTAALMLFGAIAAPLLDRSLNRIRSASVEPADLSSLDVSDVVREERR